MWEMNSRRQWVEIPKGNGFGVREEAIELGEGREVLVNGWRRAGTTAKYFKGVWGSGPRGSVFIGMYKKRLERQRSGHQGQKFRRERMQQKELSVYLRRGLWI